jgi:diguanylate cyclase (GGDEF)-like protein
VAVWLPDNLRASDIVALYGGEEFLVAMSGGGAEETANISEKPRVTIDDRPIDRGQVKLPIKISVVGALADDMAKAPSLITAADTAKYRAKAPSDNRAQTATEARWRPAINCFGSSSFPGNRARNLFETCLATLM